MLDRTRYKTYRWDREKLEKLKTDAEIVSDTVRGSSPEPPYTQRTVKVSGYSQQRKAKIARLEARCAEVEEDIERAPENVREALKLRYMEGLAWDQVGQRLGRKPDACRMSCKRYMKKARP